MRHWARIDPLNRENIILSILVLGTMMGAIDATIVLLALPALTASLHSDLASTIWAIIIYLLVIAVTTTQFGRLGDIYGKGKLFNLGFGAFTLGSLLCGFSPSISALIIFRVIQAVGGALMQANSGAIVADLFDAARRGKAFGYISFGWNMGAMIGIVLGGILTTFIGWRSIFFINVPIGVVALALGLIYIKDNVTISDKVDLLGMGLLGTSLSLISFGAINFASYGGSSSDAYIIVSGMIGLCAFIAWERKAKSPMLHIEAFSNRVLSASILASLFQSLGFLSVTFILIMYLQGVRGLSPLIAAGLLIPGYLVSSMLSPKMGSLSYRFGARAVATIGIALMGIAIIIYLTLGAESPYYVVVIGSVISGLGGAMFWPANNSAVMSNAEPRQYGSISGLLRLTSNIGALGSYVIVITAATLAVPRQLSFEIFIGTSKLTGGISDAFINGIHAALLMSLSLLFIAAILSVSRGKKR